MNYMGIGDEAANSIDGQIRATQELGWKLLEPRGVEVPGRVNRDKIAAGFSLLRG